MGSDDFKDKTREFINNASRDLNRAWGEVKDGVTTLSMTLPSPRQVTRQVEEEIVHDSEECYPPVQPQPIPEHPDPEPTPMDLTMLSNTEEHIVDAQVIPEPSTNENTILMNEVEEERKVPETKFSIPHNFKYRTELEIMFEMGFTDVDTQVKLLNKYRGNVE